MKGTNTLNIIQYNVNKSKNIVQHHLLQALDPLRHHIVALQEPWRHPTENTSIKHPAYHLVFPDGHKGRTCIYVSKHLAVGKWRVEKTPEADGDITSISIQTDIGKIHVINTYNPPPLSHSSKELGTLKHLPDLLSKTGRHILVGDFNLHHPRWGGLTVLSHHKLAEDLIEILGNKDMELVLPEGTITWSNRGSQSTLDLVFLSKELEGLVATCQPACELEASSDHIPISTQLIVQASSEDEVKPCPQWKKADWDEFNVRLDAKLMELKEYNFDLDSHEAIDQRVSSITKTIQKIIQEIIPIAKPSKFAKPYWTNQCSEAVKDTRKARRKWQSLGTEESWIEYQKSTSKKKAQIKRAKTIGWRAAVSEASRDPSKIWKLAKWARKDPEEKQRLPQIPDITDADGCTHTEAPEKARIMAGHFFPQPMAADTADIAEANYPEELHGISSIITHTEVEEALTNLPSDKAPGPDGIPNRLLKKCKLTLSKDLADLFNACLSLGYHPKGFKESTTVVLRKPQKPRYDTPKSYRPIALLNTMGKLLEKLVANRLSKAAEDFNLLPEEQMGARPKRSTISAVELLTEQIHTIWGKNKKQVASLLSLDISGAFDNVSHERLIHNLRQKGIPRWISRYVGSFLKGRTTSIVLGTYRGDQIPTNTGIPQGSSLSPILFLFFVSTLLPMLQSHSTAAVGFVDDTNILTWSNTTEENCRKLEEQHRICEKWAKTHGVKFAPEKYQLMHFTRARKKRHNLEATINIQGHLTAPQSSLRVLGIYFDPKLNWGAHIKKIHEKSDNQVQVISRLAQSTWGATFKKSKLLYSTIVRPALTYGSSIWAEVGPAAKIPERIVKPLRSIQRKCLKLVTGAYNSTSSRVLEHESSVLPIEIYLKQRRVQHAGLSDKLPVRRNITTASNRINPSVRGREEIHVKKRNSDVAEWNRICGREENISRQKAAGKIAAFQEWRNSWACQNNIGHPTPANPETWKAANLTVNQYTGRKKMNLRGTPSEIHQNLSRAQSSIAMQMRSEHIGLNSYLHRRKVPGVESPKCQCGYPSQNVRHMVMTCPKWARGRGDILRKSKDRSYEAMIQSPEDVARITKWILDEGYLEQFCLVSQVEAVMREKISRAGKG